MYDNTNSVVIMASGYSTRMGQNKLFLRYQGQTFLERTLQLVQEIPFTRVILVIKPNDLINCNLPDMITVILNTSSEQGQSASVRLGSAVAIGQGCLYLPIDQPLLDSKTLESLLDVGTASNIVFPSVSGHASSPVYFGRQFFSELCQVTGTAGGRQVKQRHRQAWVPVAVDPQRVQDIDTPQQYRRLIGDPQVNTE